MLLLNKSFLSLTTLVLVALWRYKAIQYQCKLFGEQVPKGTGARPNQRSFKQGCRARLRLSANKTKNGLVITAIDSVHNHKEISSTKVDLPETSNELLEIDFDKIVYGDENSLLTSYGSTETNDQPGKSQNYSTGYGFTETNELPGKSQNYSTGYALIDSNEQHDNLTLSPYVKKKFLLLDICWPSRLVHLLNIWMMRFDFQIFPYFLFMLCD